MESPTAAEESAWMRRALDLAKRGQGSVEPNPMVGCVLVKGRTVIAEGWHERYGGPHAEINALQKAGENAREAAAYVTLEPCSHFGKTPPCVQALIRAGVSRVVAAMADPFPEVAGRGLEQLRQAGIEVSCGLHEAEAKQLNAPYLKLITQQRPWVIAKWAMTLDGRIASRSGHSQWISNEQSRAIVHQIRGRVDGILVGSNTALTDDPLLTARPTGPRIATRLVFDSQLRLPAKSKLVQTAGEFPTLLATSAAADQEKAAALRTAGVEVLLLPGASHLERLNQLLDELGRRRMTNLLVEGGGGLLGALFDAQAMDEVHVFLAPKIIGGQAAAAPVGGMGLEKMSEAAELAQLQIQQLGTDIYLAGRLPRG